MHLYHHSGAVPPIGGAICLLGAIAAGLVVGSVNACMVHWMPMGLGFIIGVPLPLSFVLTVVLAAILGWLLRLLRWHGRVRNAWFYGAAAVLAFLFAQWAYWSVSQFASGWAEPSWQAWLPGSSIAYAAHRIQKDGNLLMFWWVLEFVTIAAALFVCVQAHLDQPFCERCDWWTETTPGFMLFQSSEHDEAWQRFRAGDVHTIDQLPMLTRRAGHYLRLNIASCPSCERSRFVAVQKISPSRLERDRREGKVTEDEFIPYQELSADEWAYLQSLIPPPEPAGEE